MSLVPYSDVYVEQLFEQWYLLGCPSYKEFHKKISPAEDGRKPHPDVIGHWAAEHRWAERRDELLARASRQMEDDLVKRTVEMWKRHADQAQKIGGEAFAKLSKEGFDSSASALQALKWAQEEERRTRGVETFYKKVKDSSDDELLRTIRQLAERSASTEAEIIDAPEDAEP